VIQIDSGIMVAMSHPSRFMIQTYNLHIDMSSCEVTGDV